MVISKINFKFETIKGLTVYERTTFLYPPYKRWDINKKISYKWHLETMLCFSMCFVVYIEDLNNPVILHKL